MRIDTIEEFLPYFENVRGRTERVIAVIPPHRLEWQPRAGAFSFGDVIRHLAAVERYMFGERTRVAQPLSRPWY